MRNPTPYKKTHLAWRRDWRWCLWLCQVWVLQAGVAAVSRWGRWSPAARDRHEVVGAARMQRRNPLTRDHWIPGCCCLQVDRRNSNWTQNPRQRRHPLWVFPGAEHCPDSHSATDRFWKRPSSLANRVNIDRTTHFLPTETIFRHPLKRLPLDPLRGRIYPVLITHPLPHRLRWSY